MNWSALTKKQQQMVVITALLAVGQIFLMAHFLGWFKPASARGGSAKEELLSLQKKIEDARDVLRREEQVRRDLTVSIGKLENLTVHAPTLSDRYAWSYEYVSRCARQARVELDSLEEIVFLSDPKSPDKKKPEADQPYEIKVSTRCGYNNLVELLWRLEKDNPLLRIKEVTVAAVRDNPLIQQVQIVIQWPASVKIERGTP
jgi:hypothetical protein